MRLARAPRMNRKLSWSCVGVVLAQGRYRERAQAGPWRVVISKPVVGLGFTADTLYREHEYLGAMFNQLDRDGLEPVSWQVMTQRAEGLLNEDRMLVLCRVK
jgi:hypothetical protein